MHGQLVGGGGIATIWNIIFSPGIGLWIPIMLALSSTKRYAVEHNLLATELKAGQKHK